MLAIIANKWKTNNLETIQLSIENRMDKYTVINSQTRILHIALKMNESASIWMNIRNVM